MASRCGARWCAACRHGADARTRVAGFPANLERLENAALRQQNDGLDRGLRLAQKPTPL